MDTMLINFYRLITGFIAQIRGIYPPNPRMQNPQKPTYMQEKILAFVEYLTKADVRSSYEMLPSIDNAALSVKTNLIK
jgi:hypothetical protein